VMACAQSNQGAFSLARLWVLSGSRIVGADLPDCGCCPQVEFSGPYPMEGGKGVESAVTRYVARLLRKQQPAGARLGLSGVVLHVTHQLPAVWARLHMVVPRLPQPCCCPLPSLACLIAGVVVSLCHVRARAFCCLQDTPRRAAAWSSALRPTARSSRRRSW